MDIEQKFSCKKAMPIYQQLRNKILEEVEHGELRNGNKLPTEEEFARRLCISRGTVRQAFARLQEEGIIKKFPRKGTFISLDNLCHVMRIGILSPQMPLNSEKSNDFYLMELLCGIEEGLVASGAMLIPLNASDSSSAIAEFCQRRQINGVIFLMPHRCDEEKMKQLKKKLQLPMVIISADPAEDVNTVTIDDEYGSALVAKHLQELGHSKIGAIFVDSTEYASGKRYKGFINSLEETVKRKSISYIKTIRSRQETRFSESYHVAKELMSIAEPPTAIYAGGALLLLGTLRALKELKLEIPRDVSLVGYDDFFLAEYYTPPLTVVAQPIRQVGFRAVELLLERIRHGIGRPKFKECLKPKLIIRCSTQII